MKILFAIKTLDNVYGGAERVLADITSELSERGHKVSVLSFDSPGGVAFYPLNKKVKRIPLGIGNVKRKATLREVISRMTAIRKAAIRMQPDVVIAFMHSTFIPASFAMIGTGVPIIASEHIVPDHYRSRKWEYVLLLLSRFFIRKITVLSQSIIDSYPKVLQSKMFAVANPVHSVVPKTFGKVSGAKRKTILNVGRLAAQKDQETLIRSFANLVNEYPDWDLRIVGDGELRDDLEAVISQLGMEERVFMAGTTSDIAKEYQSADIFALPSEYESFGLATAEAMAHGLPTIGFASSPGTNELIVHEQNGLLVDDKDRIQAFADGLRVLMDDKALRCSLGKVGLKTIEKFHPHPITDEWERLIKIVCD